MTVFVDNMLREAQVGRGRLARWSHLFADTHDELEVFASRLGLKASWLQHAGTHREHYDVTMSVRAKAIQLGAVQISYPAGVANLIETRRAICECTRLADCRWVDRIAIREAESNGNGRV